MHFMHVLFIKKHEHEQKKEHEQTNKRTDVLEQESAEFSENFAQFLLRIARIF